MARASAAKRSEPVPQGFAGFRPAALGFFRDLAAHQEKAWFEANRAVYEQEVLGPLRALVAGLVTECSRRRLPLTADPMKAVFRIHRDVRFSRDKSPYKTHAGAVLSRDGGKTGYGVCYLHIDPSGCFAAVGFYQPDPPKLDALRRAVLDEPERIQNAIAALTARGGQLMREEMLTRLPRGFEHAAGAPVAELIRLRSLVVTRPISAPELADAALVTALAEFAEAARPLLEFGWEAV